MTSSQIVLLVLGALIVYVYVKKYLTMKSVKHYDASEAAARMKNNRNVVLLDVRTPKERKENHIKGSLHIPLYELKAKANELNKYKGKEIICYCRSGNRSVNAAATLKKLGFNAANLKGGIIRWNSNR